MRTAESAQVVWITRFHVLTLKTAPAGTRLRGNGIVVSEQLEIQNPSLQRLPNA